MDADRCTLCKNPGELHRVDNPDLRICTPCREKLGTHIAVFCSGCDTLFWLRKTPSNVMTASKMSDLAPEHIMQNYLVHELKSCKLCYDAAKDFMASAGWVQ